MTESLEIQELLRAAMRERYGRGGLAERFRAFDTICSATQDRQDAVLKMLGEGGLDVMVVIGGYNSSNTQALARICAERLPTFHIRGRGPHRGPVDPPSAGRRATHETTSAALAARGPGHRRPHRGRLDAQQRRGRGGREGPRAARPHHGGPRRGLTASFSNPGAGPRRYSQA